MFTTERLCREPHEIPGHVKVTNEQGEPISSLRWRRSVSDVSEMQGHMSSERAAAFQSQATPSRPIVMTPPVGFRKQASICTTKTEPSTALSDKHGTGQAVGRLATITRKSLIKKPLTSYMNSAEGGVSFSESLDFLKLSITANSVSSADSQSEFETLKEPTEILRNEPPSLSREEEKLMARAGVSEDGGLDPVSADSQSKFEMLKGPTEILHDEPPPPSREEEKLTAGAGVSEDGGLGPVSNFRPLLLFIPLRLGQDGFNMEYAVALKVK